MSTTEPTEGRAKAPVRPRGRALRLVHPVPAPPKPAPAGEQPPPPSTEKRRPRWGRIVAIGATVVGLAVGGVAFLTRGGGSSTSSEGSREKTSQEKSDKEILDEQFDFGEETNTGEGLTSAATPEQYQAWLERTQPELTSPDLGLLDNAERALAWREYALNSGNAANGLHFMTSLDGVPGQLLISRINQINGDRASSPSLSTFGFDDVMLEKEVVGRDSVRVKFGETQVLERKADGTPQLTGESGEYEEVWTFEAQGSETLVSCIERIGDGVREACTPQDVALPVL